MISYNRMGEETSPFLLLDYADPSMLLVTLIGVPFMIYSTIKCKGKMDINLQPSNCANRRTPFPAVCIPANFRQLLFGGNTCRKRNTEVDKCGAPRK